MNRGRLNVETGAMSFAAVICLIAAVQADRHGPSPGYGPQGGSSGHGSGRDNGEFDFADDRFRGGLEFDVDKATNYRTVHGILAAMAFVILFPVGAMTMRLVPGRAALWLHAITQVVSYIIFIAAVGLGIWLVQEVRIPAAGGSLLNISGINYHPIIGLVVFAALFFQPILGLIHHSQFKKLRRRQVWSHLHLWNGRIMIPLGIINGGLGLRMAGASNGIKTAYGAVAGVLGGLWLLVAIFSEVRRRKAARQDSPAQVSHRQARREERREKLTDRERARADSQSS